MVTHGCNRRRHESSLLLKAVWRGREGETKRGRLGEMELGKKNGDKKKIKKTTEEKEERKRRITKCGERRAEEENWVR